MDRAGIVRAIDEILEDRRLVWVGLRGDDAEPLSDLRQFQGAYSLISAYERRLSVQSQSYESISGLRVDPETWDIDDHLTDQSTAVFRQDLLRALSAECVVVPYRPSQFLSSILFARSTRCTALGIFGALQSALEHKPWVETAVAGLQIPRVRWRYIADEEQLAATSMFDEGPVILRRSRTSGGEGMVRVENLDEMVEHWPRLDEAFASVAPFIEGAIPVNVGAVVWADGVTAHHVSVQLIGVPHLVTRPFGYCGNDFGAARDLPEEALTEIQDAVQNIGAWLRQHGFRGAFGLDFLVSNGHALFLEVNPRFQGSTHASARLDAEAGESCLMLEHVAAWLDIPAPKGRSIDEIVQSTPDFAHLVTHWPGDTALLDVSALSARIRADPATVRVELEPPRAIRCEHGSAVLRWTLRRRVTTTGYHVLPEFDGIDSRLVYERGNED